MQVPIPGAAEENTAETANQLLPEEHLVDIHDQCSKEDLQADNEMFSKTLDDCVQSARGFMSSARTIAESRTSAAGSVRGFGFASELGEPLSSERRLGIEGWLTSPTEAEDVDTQAVASSFTTSRSAPS